MSQVWGTLTGCLELRKQQPARPHDTREQETEGATQNGSGVQLPR
jgi:hypothetical protein